MKKRFLSKILVILLALMMFVPLASFTATAAEPALSSATVAQSDAKGSSSQKKAPAKAPTKQKEKKKKTKAQKRKIVSDYLDGKKLRHKFSENGADALNSLAETIPALVNVCKNVSGEDEYDVMALTESIVSLVSGVAACCGPYGQAIGAVFNIGVSIAKMIMGGAEPTSEMAQMEDRLTQQLDAIQNQLSGIEEQINSLSDEINASTNKIIETLTAAIDDAAAKDRLIAFMETSGMSDFGYNQYRNYIYGGAQDNANAQDAYYAKLKQAIATGASAEVVKGYYDQLYSALMNNRQAYYDAVIGNGAEDKSIVQSYYDVITSNDEYVPEGESAELMAIMFAYDIYQTEMMVNQIVMSCNLYQYSQMLLADPDAWEYANGELTVKEGKSLKYEYEKSTGKFVTLQDIENMSGNINTRVDEITAQLIEDIVYILEIENYYTVKADTDEIYEIENVQQDTYGFVLENQTVYLPQIPEEVCNLFGLEHTDFSYQVSVEESVDGVFAVPENVSTITATLQYQGDNLETFVLRVGAGPVFNGGNGTPENPYLIANAAQFLSIADGMDQHYCLIDDIDFSGMTINPIGEKLNSSDNIAYDEFTGSLYGNGYTVSGVNVIGNGEYTGLFAIVGEEGEIADLSLYNVMVSATLQEAKTSDSKFYAGMIAGQNLGIIKYCSIDSDPEVLTKYGLSFDLKYAITQGSRHISVYAGGITGTNSDTLYGCVVANSSISASTSHDFKGNTVSDNHNKVYVGGLCGHNYGSISSSVVKESVKLSSHAKSVLSPSKTVKPTVYAYAGGIAAYSNSLAQISNVQSAAKIEECVAETERVDSNYEIKRTNCKERPGDYVPEYTEDELKAIISDDVEQFLAQTEPSYTLSYRNDCTAYAAGDTLQYTLPCSNGVNPFDPAQKNTVQAIYAASGYTVTLLNNGTGSITDGKDKAEFQYLLQDDGTLSLIGNDVQALNVAELCYDKEQNALSLRVYNVFRADELHFFVNGEEVEYEILELYGFDVLNETFESTKQKLVVLLRAKWETENGVEDLYFTEEIEVLIGENKITEIEVLGLKHAYVSGTFTPLGLQIVYHYAVGAPSGFTVTQEMIDQKVVRYFGDINSFGEQTLLITHNGKEIKEAVINVVCGHGNNFTDPSSGYSRVEIKASTCTEIGYELYRCTCGDEQYFYLRKIAHTPDYANAVGKMEATCMEEGNTGSVLCGVCKMLLIEGATLPKKPHSYVYFDETKHVCENGAHDEYHHYTVTESVEYAEKDGIVNQYVFYTYTCECGYSDRVQDENTVTSESAQLPTVIVSNGYVLPGGGEVVVYVQIINNRGFNAANFGIRYSEGLELIAKENGTLFEGNMIPGELDGAVTYGYNFVWANTANPATGDGNLLKLTFRVSEEAALKAVSENIAYKVSVVYGVGEGVEGGFSYKEDGKVIAAYKVITKDGFIQVVEHLPGDVNSDGRVDMMDVVEIAKHLSNPGKYFVEERYADIDLNHHVNIDDLLRLLCYITGDVGGEIVTQDFEIILNTNIEGEEYANYKASIYGDDENLTNQTYANLPQLERQGYKFLGWSYKMYTTNPADLIPGASDERVEYRFDLRAQTLYAQWEINSITFERGEATNDAEATVYYKESFNINQIPSPERKYHLAFYSDLSSQARYNGLMQYAFQGWYCAQTQTTYQTKEETLDMLLGENQGAVILIPIFGKTPSVDYPKWTSVVGYEEELTYHYTNDDNESSRIDFSYILENLNNLSTLSEGGITYYQIYANHIPIEYVLIIDFKNGSNPIVIDPCSVEHTYTLNNTVTKKGYTLGHWEDNYGNTYKKEVPHSIGAIEGVKARDRVTISAQWINNEYTVTYDANKPSNASPSSTVTGIPSPATWVYEQDNVLGAAPKLKGWVFDGWCLDKDGTMKYGEAGEKHYLDKTGDIKLYARWAPKKYTVVFDSAGGTAQGSATVYTGQAYYFNKPTRNGFEFSGWYYNNQLCDGKNWNIDVNNVKLVAKWTPGIIKLDTTGGNVSISEQSVTAEGTYGNLPEPTRSGYAFAGWYSEPTNGTKVSSSSTILFEGAVGTVYARWVKTNTTFSHGVTAQEDRCTISWYKGNRKSATDVIYFGLSRADLLSLKYTKIKVSMTFNCRVENWGNQLVQIQSNEYEEVTRFQYEWKECGWKKVTVEFELSLINDVDDYSYFLVHWDNFEDGTGSDTWYVGGLTFTIEAV